jgi:hypothetical protein
MNTYYIHFKHSLLKHTIKELTHLKFAANSYFNLFLFCFVLYLQAGETYFPLEKTFLMSKLTIDRESL